MAAADRIDRNRRLTLIKAPSQKPTETLEIAVNDRDRELFPIGFLPAFDARTASEGWMRHPCPTFPSFAGNLAHAFPVKAFTS